MEPMDLDSQPDVVHHDVTAPSGHSASRGWRWLWLLVPIAIFVGLILWILV